MTKNKIILAGFVLFVFSCTKPSIRFIPINQFGLVDNRLTASKKLRNKCDFYLVEGFQYKYVFKLLIDSVANKNRNLNIRKYENYSILFYKLSDKTNIANLKENPDVFANYSNKEDLVFLYKWKNGVLIRKDEINKGKVVEPKTGISISGSYSR